MEGVLGFAYAARRALYFIRLHTRKSQSQTSTLGFSLTEQWTPYEEEPIAEPKIRVFNLRYQNLRSVHHLRVPIRNPSSLRALQLLLANVVSIVALSLVW